MVPGLLLSTVSRAVYGAAHLRCSGMDCSLVSVAHRP